MRRALATIILTATIALPLAACGSSSETSTSSTTTTAKPSGNTTKGQTPRTTAPVDPKCKPLNAWALADYGATQAANKSQAEKDKISGILDTTSATAKQTFPDLAIMIDTRLAYLRKVISGQNIPQNEKDAADKALQEINGVRKADCKAGVGKRPETAPKAGGGATTTTAK